MWPMLLNLTRDECRLTLRRLGIYLVSQMAFIFPPMVFLNYNSTIQANLAVGTLCILVLLNCVCFVCRIGSLLEYDQCV